MPQTAPDAIGYTPPLPAAGPAESDAEPPDPYLESVKVIVAEMTARAAGLPDPDRAGICADCRWIDDNWMQAALAPYRGQFVAVLDETVVGHGADELLLRRDVARARDVHPSRLVIVYVPVPGL